MAYRPTDATRKRAEEKRSGFVRAARDLIAAHGFAKAKVSAIARGCGASTGSLYSYFDSRDELLAEVFADAAMHELATVRDAVAQARDAPVSRIDALVETFVGRALRGRQMAWSLLFEPVSPVVEEQRLVYRRAYVELGEGVIRDGVAQGVFAVQDVTLAASALMGAISEALSGRLNPVGLDSLSRMSDELVIAEIRAFSFRALGATATPTTLASFEDETA